MTETPEPNHWSDRLAEVTLLTERGAYAEALEVAHAMLVEQPNSAAVHAALGDVAAARHLHREAIEWYELSLRLEQNQTVREQLARQQDLLDEERLREVTEELDPPRDNRMLIIGGAVAGFLVLALVVGLVTSSLRHRDRGRDSVTGPPQRPAGRLADRTGDRPATGAQAPRPATRAGDIGPYGVGAGSAVSPTPPGNDGDLRVTQSVDAPMADRDVLLTRSLAALTWGNGEALRWRVQALMDPFTGYAMITIEVPPSVRGGDLYGPVISMAYNTAVSALRADRGIDSLTVRFITQIEDESGKRATLVAFRGNTTREAVDYFTKHGINPDHQTIWTRVFATTWWNPSVPAGTGTATTEQPGG